MSIFIIAALSLVCIAEGLRILQLQRRIGDLERRLEIHRQRLAKRALGRVVQNDSSVGRAQRAPDY